MPEWPGAAYPGHADEEDTFVLEGGEVGHIDVFAVHQGAFGLVLQGVLGGKAWIGLDQLDVALQLNLPGGGVDDFKLLGLRQVEGAETVQVGAGSARFCPHRAGSRAG